MVLWKDGAAEPIVRPLVGRRFVSIVRISESERVRAHFIGQGRNGVIEWVIDLGNELVVNPEQPRPRSRIRGDLVRYGYGEWLRPQGGPLQRRVFEITLGESRLCLFFEICRSAVLIARCSRLRRQVAVDRKFCPYAIRWSSLIHDTRKNKFAEARELEVSPKFQLVMIRAG